MKIAIASDLYYPMTNGVAVFAHNLALGLAKRGHEVLVICPSFTGRKYHVKRDGVRTEHLRSMRFPFYPDQIEKVEEGKIILGRQLPKIVYENGIWWAPFPEREVKSILNRFQPDVIHNQTAETIAVAVTNYARKNGIPLVATGHAYPDNITGQVTNQLKFLKPMKKPADAVLRAYMASFLKHAEYATMPTEVAIEDLVPKNRKRFKVPVEALSNGVDLSKFRPGKAGAEIYRKFKLPKDRPMVLYLGRVDPEKSIDKVLEAFFKVLQQVPETLLVVAGDGIAKESLVGMARELRLEENVRFLGKVTPSEAAELYRAAKVFATASKTETQGIVLIEAAATGLPIVAVDAGAVREVCQDGRNGFLCQADDTSGIAEGLIRVLREPELAKRMGAESLEIAKVHDLNRTLERFEEIYKKAVGDVSFL